MARQITPAQHCAIVSRSAAANSGRADMFAKFGETQAAALKRQAAATKRTPAESRDFPVFKPGMSTMEYVRAFETLNSCRQFQPGFYELVRLNCDPAALYAGGMLDYAPDCKELADDGAPVLADVAPGADPAELAQLAEHAPADAAAPSDVDPADLAEVKAAAAPMLPTPCPGIPDDAPAGRTATEAAAELRKRATAIYETAPDESQPGNARAWARAHESAADAIEAAAGPVDHTPYRVIQDGAPSTADPAGDAMAADVAEWLAKTWPRLADDPRPRCGLTLAAQVERQRAARIHGRYAEIAAACADILQARADALPVPPAASRTHAPFDGFGGAWQEIRIGRAEPDEYRAHVIEAMQAAKAAGLFYNAETYPRAAAVMAARWDYPDLREAADVGGPDCDSVPPWFALHCYMAGDVIRAREAREAHRQAREGLRLAVGVKLGALVFTDYKLTRGAEVAEVSDDGEQITITGNRGAAAVRIQCAPLAVRGAIERAHEKGKRRDSYAEFCAGRPAPVAAAIVAPVADPEPASLAEPVASVADAVAQCYGPDIDAASLADLQAATETAATLAGAIDAAAAGADAVRLLRAEAARVRLAADGQPVRVAARYLVASAMLAHLAMVRAVDLPGHAEPIPTAMVAPVARIRPARIPRQPGQGPAHARPQPGRMPAAAGARRAAAMIEPAGPTCYPWRNACGAGQLARPPPGR